MPSVQAVYGGGHLLQRAAARNNSILTGGGQRAKNNLQNTTASSSWDNVQDDVFFPMGSHCRAANRSLPAEADHLQPPHPCSPADDPLNSSRSEPLH